MEKILSISVAAYNVEKYLDQLMQSVIASGAIDDLEVLIVNDGSKDGTADKAMEYQKKYPQSVRLIDKENGGHGSTINRGITEATGKYFRALDGDDWVHSEHLGKLVEKMKNIDADYLLRPNLSKRVADDFKTVVPFVRYLNRPVDYAIEEWM